MRPWRRARREGLCGSRISAARAREAALRRQALGLGAARAGAGEAVRTESHGGGAGPAQEEAGEGAVVGSCPGNPVGLRHGPPAGSRDDPREGSRQAKESVYVPGIPAAVSAPSAASTCRWSATPASPANVFGAGQATPPPRQRRSVRRQRPGSSRVPPRRHGLHPQPQQGPQASRCLLPACPSPQ